MSDEVIFHIPKLSDGKVITGFRSACEASGLTAANLYRFLSDPASRGVTYFGEEPFQGTELPTPLIEKLTKNLFVDSDTKVEFLRPTEQVANTLFGAAGEATTALPGGTLKLDRRSIKVLDKTVSE